MHYLGLYIYITNGFKNLFDVSEYVTKFYRSVHSMTAHICNN